MVSKRIAKHIGGFTGKRLARRITAAIALGTFLPVGTVLAAPEENKEASTNYLELLDYFITAERIPTGKWDTPANVTVITADEIEANHYQDIYEALIHVNGVAFGTGALDANMARLNGNKRVVVLMDGRRSSLSAIPSMKIIERIEIVKGSGSALYGSDGVGGVINVITKKGEKSETSVDLNTGSWHTHNYEITTQGTDGRLSWFIAGNLGRQGYYKYRDGSGEHRSVYGDYDKEGVSVRLDHRFDERNSITFDIAHRRNDNHFNYTSPWSPVGGKVLRQYTDNNLYVTYNFKEGTSVPGFFSYFNNYSYSDNQGKIYAKMQGFDYQNGWESGRHKLIAGLEWHQRKDSALRGGYENAKRTTQAYYLQDTISLTDKWTLVPGVRFDHSTQYGGHWSPKVAVNYRADNKTKVYATWGKVFQEPSANDLYYADSTGMMGNANPHLDPESGHSETIGFEHDFDEKTGVSLTLFNTKLDDVVGWYSVTTADMESDYTSGNVGSEKQRGLELLFRQKINDDWSYDVGYSHTHIEANGSNAHYPQPNGYRLGVHYQHGPWHANLLSIMANKLDDTQYATDKYATFDFNLGYAVSDHATVYFKARNFTNQYQRHYSDRSKFFQVGVDCKF